MVNIIINSNQSQKTYCHPGCLCLLNWLWIHELSPLTRKNKKYQRLIYLISFRNMTDIFSKYFHVNLNNKFRIHQHSSMTITLFSLSPWNSEINWSKELQFIQGPKYPKQPQFNWKCFVQPNRPMWKNAILWSPGISSQSIHDKHSFKLMCVWKYP